MRYIQKSPHINTYTIIINILYIIYTHKVIYVIDIAYIYTISFYISFGLCAYSNYISQIGIVMSKGMCVYNFDRYSNTLLYSFTASSFLN